MEKQDTRSTEISVIINKEEVLVEKGITIIRILEERGVKSRSSVWVNGKQLLLSEYEGFIVNQGDEIKILRVVAGG